MFVYLLIAAELAVLYTVFWYLYLREPTDNRRISARMWGSYDNDDLEQADPTLPEVVRFGIKDLYDMPKVQCPEYVLDHKTNRYVQAEESQGVIKRMAAQVDRRLSRLNVKP
jgi:hypothetical protein